MISIFPTHSIVTNKSVSKISSPIKSPKKDKELYDNENTSIIKSPGRKNNKDNTYVLVDRLHFFCFFPRVTIPTGPMSKVNRHELCPLPSRVSYVGYSNGFVLISTMTPVPF